MRCSLRAARFTALRLQFHRLQGKLRNGMNRTAAYEVLIDDNDVSKALLDYINKHFITVFIVAASTRHPISRYTFSYESKMQQCSQLHCLESSFSIYPFLLSLMWFGKTFSSSREDIEGKEMNETFHLRVFGLTLVFVKLVYVAIFMLKGLAEFEDAAFKPPLNKVARCITKFGWHLLQVLSEREESILEGISPVELHVKM